MRTMKTLTLSLCGALILMASAVTATSNALPEILTSGFKWTANEKSTTEFSILGGFAITKCSEVEAEFAGEGTGILGLFHFTLKGSCTTNIGGTCTGLGDAAGTILILGSYHLVYDTLGALGAAILYLLQHVHYQCTVLAVEKLILVLGQLLCLLGTINALTTTNEVKCLGTGGDPKETRYWNDAGTEVSIAEGFLASENEGVTYKMAAQQSNNRLTYNQEMEIMA